MPITIMCDEETITLLQRIAQESHVTIEAMAERALRQYAHQLAAQKRPYTFIGIGHSGTPDLSRRVEDIFEQGANHLEGWSLN